MFSRINASRGSANNMLLMMMMMRMMRLLPAADDDARAIDEFYHYYRCALFKLREVNAILILGKNLHRTYIIYGTWHDADGGV